MTGKTGSYIINIFSIGEIKMKKLLSMIMVLFAIQYTASANTIDGITGVDRSVLAVFDTWRIDPSYDSELIVPDTTSVVGDSDSFFSDYGIADLELGSSAQYLDSYNGADDVIYVADDMDMCFYVANFFGGEYKELYVEVTYYSDYDAIPYVDIWETSEGEYQGYEVSAPDYWYYETDSSGWTTVGFSVYIEPNPYYELFDLNFQLADSWDGYPVYVDQVVIETVCVPEPISIISVAGGLVAMLARKRRQA